LSGDRANGRFNRPGREISRSPRDFGRTNPKFRHDINGGRDNIGRSQNPPADFLDDDAVTGIAFALADAGLYHVGVKPDRPWSAPWIAANHKSEGAVSLSAAAKNRRLMGAIEY
jgi:hypothetical protein